MKKRKKRKISIMSDLIHAGILREFITFESLGMASERRDLRFLLWQLFKNNKKDSCLWQNLEYVAVSCGEKSGQEEKSSVNLEAGYVGATARQGMPCPPSPTGQCTRKKVLSSLHLGKVPPISSPWFPQNALRGAQPPCLCQGWACPAGTRVGQTKVQVNGVLQCRQRTA